MNERRMNSVTWIPLFKNIDEKPVTEALGEAEVLIIPAGDPLLQPGESNQSVYIPLSGEIAVFLDSDVSADRAIPIALGECLGELSAIDGKPVSALVLAIRESRVLKLSQDVFWGRLAVLPGFALNLMATICQRLRGASERSLRTQREQLELSHWRKELDLARQLQTSMVPMQRPLFPDRDEIDVCGYMEPASNVGGDFFDAFFIDENNLFFCIGDVSGHGIAAALFMARTIGLLRVLAMNTMQPSQLLQDLNARLCQGNDICLFVTLFCGFLDVRNGHLRYSNGGHCAPLLFSKDGARPLDIPKGALIGALEGMDYSSMEHTLGPGDTLFCLTDGVSEAQDAAGVEFSEDRCLTFISRAGAVSLPNLIDTLRMAVSTFTGSALLEDDCTMLALRRPT